VTILLEVNDVLDLEDSVGVVEMVVELVVLVGLGLDIVATIVAVSVGWVSGRAPGMSTHIL
jgi:hypothetical protein